MKLYKYVDLKTGIDHIIKNKNLKFTKPIHFNDPLETDAFDYKESNNSYENHAYESSLKNNYGILCLTRNPSNLLMWSHYAPGCSCGYDGINDSSKSNIAHGGLAIGINANTAGLNDPNKMVIPANHGSIIYTATKPTHPYVNSEHGPLLAGEVKDYKPELIDALQRFFLYKSKEWAYEEEVRAVKNITSKENEILEIPCESIVEVYIGLGQKETNAQKCIRDFVLEHVPSAKVYIMEKDHTRWAVVPKEITSADL